MLISSMMNFPIIHSSDLIRLNLKNYKLCKLKKIPILIVFDLLSLIVLIITEHAQQKERKHFVIVKISVHTSRDIDTTLDKTNTFEHFVEKHVKSDSIGYMQQLYILNFCLISLFPYHFIPSFNLFERI